LDAATGDFFVMPTRWIRSLTRISRGGWSQSDGGQAEPPTDRYAGKLSSCCDLGCFVQAGPAKMVGHASASDTLVLPSISLSAGNGAIQTRAGHHHYAAGRDHREGGN